MDRNSHLWKKICERRTICKIGNGRNYESVEADDAPISAMIVKNGEVIAAGWSLVWPKKDPSAHGETEWDLKIERPRLF